MTTRIGSSRRKTRKLMRKPIRAKGKISLRRFLQKFENGDKVILKAEPAYQKGLYFRRFHGLTGIVTKKLGSCYEVKIYDHDKEKKLIVHPVHMIKSE